jgi:hypothetical protein
MATDKRQFTLRLQDDIFEKIRYLAFVDRRSIAMEMEHILLEYIASYEERCGKIKTSQEELA